MPASRGQSRRRSARPRPRPASRAARSQSRKIESVLRVILPAPRCQSGYVKSALRDSHPRRKKGGSIPHIFPMKNILPNDSQINTPHVHVTRESHPSICTHHAAAEHAGWLPVRDDAPCSSIIRVHMKLRVSRRMQDATHIFGRGTVHSSREGTNTHRPGLAFRAED